MVKMDKLEVLEEEEKAVDLDITLEPEEQEHQDKEMPEVVEMKQAHLLVEEVLEVEEELEVSEAMVIVLVVFLLLLEEPDYQVT